MKNKITEFEVNSTRWLSLDDFEGEIWNDINGFNGMYMVSNLGRVRSLFRKKSNYNQFVTPKIMRASDNGNGYLFVNLTVNNKSKRFYIHRLVASSFIQNPNNYPHINHKDENKHNNCIDNLEWCTPAYNNLYGTAKERGRKTRRDNGNCREIDMYDIRGNLIKHYVCAYDMRMDGISRRSAYNVCNGRTRSYKNFVFRFSGEPFSYRNEQHTNIPKIVIKSDIEGNVIKTYPSIRKAEADNGLSRNYLYSATYASTRKVFVNGAYFQIKLL